MSTTTFYQIAFEKRSKPGSFLLMSPSYPTHDEARTQAKRIQAQSQPQHRAKAYKVFRVTRECVETSE